MSDMDRLIVKIECDTSDLDKLKDEYGFVTKSDVERMISDTLRVSFRLYMRNINQLEQRA